MKHPPFNRRELALFSFEQGTSVYHVETLLVTTQFDTQPELNLVHEASRIPNPHCAITIPANPIIKELKEKVGGDMVVGDDSCACARARARV